MAFAALTEPKAFSRFWLTHKIRSDRQVVVYRAVAFPGERLAGMELAVFILHEHLAEDPHRHKEFLADRAAMAAAAREGGRLFDTGEDEGFPFYVIPLEQELGSPLGS